MNKTKFIALGLVIIGIIIRYTLKDEYDLISGLLIGCGIGLTFSRWNPKTTQHPN